MLLLQEIPFSRSQDRAQSAAQQGSFQPQLTARPLSACSSLVPVVPGAGLQRGRQQGDPLSCCWGKREAPVGEAVLSHLLGGLSRRGGAAPAAHTRSEWVLALSPPGSAPAAFPFRPQSSPLPTSGVSVLSPVLREGTSCLLFLKDTAIAAPTGLLSSRT